MLLGNLPYLYPVIKSLSLSFKAVCYLKKKQKNEEQNLIKTYRDMTDPLNVSQNFLVCFLNTVTKIIYLKYFFFDVTLTPACFSVLWMICYYAPCVLLIPWVNFEHGIPLCFYTYFFSVCNLLFFYLFSTWSNLQPSTTSLPFSLWRFHYSQTSWCFQNILCMSLL